MKITFGQKKMEVPSKNKKTLLANFLSVSILVSLVILANDYPVAAAPESSLYFNPASLSVNNGQSFSLDAVINPGANQVSGVELHITFDASRFQLSNIVNNPSAFSQVMQASQIDNANGTASIIVAVSPSNPPAPVTSTQTVATFNFDVIGGNGVSPVDFANGTLAVAIGEMSDVLVSKTSSQVTVGRSYGNSDFAVLAADWMQTKESAADADGDGTVDSRDLGIMMSNWN